MAVETIVEHPVGALMRRVASANEAPPASDSTTIAYVPPANSWHGE